MAGRRWQNACIEIRRFLAKAKLSESNLLIEPLLGLAEFLASRHRMCNWALRFRIEFRPFFDLTRSVAIQLHRADHRLFRLIEH